MAEKQGHQRSPRALRVPLLIVVLLSLAGCAGGKALPTDGDRTTEAALPVPTLTASLYQTRMDVSAGQVEVKITNGSGSEVTVNRVILESTGFAPPMTYGKSGSVLPAGWVVDMPVALSPAVCTAGSLEHEVQMDYELGDGSTGTAFFSAVDEGGRIADLHAAECFTADVLEVATLSLAGPPEERELAGDRVADLVLELSPRGGTGNLELLRAHHTTLLQLIDPTTGERQPDGYPVEVTVSGDDEPRELVLTVVPGRCDAHAIAEDKQGTRFRFDVVLNGREGTVAVDAAPEVTTALYDFVRRACRSP